MKDTVRSQRTIELFNESAVFKGLSAKARQALAALAVSIRYSKGDVVFRSQEACGAFAMVEQGLIRVSRYSALGKRLTYPLAGPG